MQLRLEDRARSTRTDILVTNSTLKGSRMAQRTWFITGVNSGFGRHMTEQLLARGDRVAGTVRDLDSMTDLKARHGAALWLAKLDLTDTPAIRRVVDRAFGELGRID